jgi:hypothetical protein
MKIKNEIKTSWDKITPSEEAQNRIYNQLLDKAKTPCPKKKFLLIPAAACLILALSLTIILTYFPDIVTDPAIPANPIDPGEFRGLPTQDFKVSDIMDDSFISRMGFLSMLNFFDIDWGLEDWSFVECVAVVQVTGIESLFTSHNEKYAEIADLKILQHIHGKPVSNNIRIKQHLNWWEGQPQLLRVGGVYIIPLGMSTSGTYYNSGIYDVLFEIDNRGLIYSHSHIGDFNRFDGRPYTELINVLKRMEQNINNPRVFSDFGRRISSSSNLIEVIITSESTYTSWHHPNDRMIAEARVIRNLSGKYIPENITLNFDQTHRNALVKDGHFLIFASYFDYFGNEEYATSSFDGGVIRNNGTLKLFGRVPDAHYTNALTPYKDYTIEQIKKIADEINWILGY